MKPGAPRDAAQAAEALEAYFLRRVLAEVKTTGGMAQGVGGDTFNEMFNEAIADEMAKAGGVGMAKQIITQLEDGAGTAARPHAPGLDGSPSGGRGLPGGAGLQGGSSLHAAVNAGIPLTETPAQGRPIALPRGAAVYAQAAKAMPPVPLTGDLTVRPVAGRITSRMGDRFDPIDGHHSHHAGVDLAAKTGTPVHAAGAGRVIRAGEASGYGNLVVVDHGDGVETRYAHLDRVDVKVGDTLAAGQAVGAAGATGRVTGPHLHFEVRKDGAPVDPSAFLRQAQMAPEPPDNLQPRVTTAKESSLKSAR